MREAPLAVWGTFRQRALNAAIAEINKKTALHVEIESLEKVGPRVNALNFSIVSSGDPEDWQGEVVKSKISGAPLPGLLERKKAIAVYDVQAQTRGCSPRV